LKEVVEQRVDIKVTRLANKNQVYILRLHVKVKANLNLEQATKAQRGSRGIAVLFLKLRR
jgi:hypothetical protein